MREPTPRASPSPKLEARFRPAAQVQAPDSREGTGPTTESTLAAGERSRGVPATTYPVVLTSECAKDIVAAVQPERTRMLVLISAWWTVSLMENTGISFDEFLAAARAGEKRAKPLWDELTKRLQDLAVAELGKWPEAVLSPEARKFIEAIVSTMGATAARKERPE